jgi:peptide/nickel transport system permease protein
MLLMIVKRLAWLLLTLFGVLLMTFILSRVLPGSPVELMLGVKPDPAQIAIAKAQLGLDQPLYRQFFNYLWNLLQGDWGTSLSTGQAVTTEIATRYPATLELVGTAVVLSVILGIPAGVLASRFQGRFLDGAVRFGSLLGAAIPIFFLGTLLQLLFHGWLGWFPLGGRTAVMTAPLADSETLSGLLMLDSLLAGRYDMFADAALHLVLPVVTLTLAILATIVRMTRNLMLEALGQEYVTTLRRYGMPEWRVYCIYAMKSALVPLLTVIGLTFGYMLGGSVVAEFVFDWPGIGGYAVNAIINNDFPAVMGVTLVLASSYLLINLLVDVACRALDPNPEEDGDA